MYQLERVDDTQDQDSFFCSAGKLPNTVKKDAKSRGMAIETLGHLCTIGLRSITPRSSINRPVWTNGVSAKAGTTDSRGTE